MLDKPMADPDIVLRTQFDDWGILFDPDTDETSGLSPTGVFIWERLDGNRTKEDILSEMEGVCEGGIPENAGNDFDEFISALREKGYVFE